MEKEADRALVSRAKAGDEGAFRVLLRKYERSVFTICLRMVRDKEEAADLAQDAFLRVFTTLEKYNPAYAFSSWLFRITSNLCIDYLRKRRIGTVAMDAPVNGTEGEYTREYKSPIDDPETMLIKNEESDRLQLAIDGLPDHYRIMILLRHQEEMSYEEIAQTLELPLGTVKARIHRARDMLKTILEELEAKESN